MKSNELITIILTRVNCNAKTEKNMEFLPSDVSRRLPQSVDKFVSRPSFRDAPFRLLFISPNKSRNEAKRNDGKISKNRKLVDGRTDSRLVKIVKIVKITVLVPLRECFARNAGPFFEQQIDVDFQCSHSSIFHRPLLFAGGGSCVGEVGR